MVYIDNDFYSTMVGNQKKGNASEVKKQMLNEIADLIAYNKPDVIEALNASGVSIAQNASDKKVIDALIENVQNNSKLQMGLGYLITTKNQTTYSNNDASGAVAGATGAAQGAAGGLGAGPIGAIIGSVAGAVGSIFNFKASKENAKAQADAQRMQLAQMVLAKKGGNPNTGLYIGLGLLVVALVVVVIVIKKKN